MKETEGGGGRIDAFSLTRLQHLEEFAHVRYGKNEARQLEPSEEGEERRETTQEASSLSFQVFGCDICLFPVISITPTWTRRDWLVQEIDVEEEKEEAEKSR